MYISIHSPYTGRGGIRQRLYNRYICISIHSPYTGRGGRLYQFWAGTGNFNPLSLYRERRKEKNMKFEQALFQSTLPIQGEAKASRYSVKTGDISIHSPYTGRGSNFAHKTPNIQPISYAKRQTKELFPTPTQQIITSLALISSISRCESPCIFMCTSHSH